MGVLCCWDFIAIVLGSGSDSWVGEKRLGFSVGDFNNALQGFVVFGHVTKGDGKE